MRFSNFVSNFFMSLLKVIKALLLLDVQKLPFYAMIYYYNCGNEQQACSKLQRQSDFDSTFVPVMLKTMYRGK